jgi:ADP-ribosylglycohydrolase
MRVDYAYMLGAILGDYLGSPFEGGVLFCSRGMSWDHPLATFTDDTVMTVACADALLSCEDYKWAFYKWGNLYPNAGYGAMFEEWLRGSAEQQSQSWGNGSGMRVSPIAWWPKIDCREEAEKSAKCTHAHPEGVRGAVAVAEAVKLALQGASVERIRAHVEDITGGKYKLGCSVQEIRNSGYEFDSSSSGSIPEALICGLEAKSFEQALHSAISLGGDTDTQACIAGALAEARFHNPKRGQKPLWKLEPYGKILSKIPTDMLMVVRQFVRVVHLQEPTF